MKNENVSPQQEPDIFIAMSEKELEAHLAIDTYGNFRLTDAIRPYPEAQLEEGFRRDHWDPENGEPTVSVIIAAASREKLFDLFLELTSSMNEQVNVILETSHASSGRKSHSDIKCEGHENIVLRSTLIDFEDLLLNDGYTGIAIMDSTPHELQLEEHKLLFMYGHRLDNFERILKRYGLNEKQSMEVVADKAHVHCSMREYLEQFEKLLMILQGGGDTDDSFASA